MNAKILEFDQRILASKKNLSDSEFLEAMSGTDSLIDHEPDTICGMCHHQFLMAQVARDMIDLNVFVLNLDVIKEWSEEVERRWKSSKFVKLWNEAVADNKDPHLVFTERGWEP